MTAHFRISFDEALGEFVAFLAREGWSTNLWWLSQERVTGYRNDFWVFRPDQLVNAERTRKHYESARRSDLNLRFDAIAQLEGHTLALVDVGPGHSSMLNFEVCTSPLRVQPIGSRLGWWFLRPLNTFRGEAPMLRCSNMPNGAELPVAADAPLNGNVRRKDD